MIGVRLCALTENDICLFLFSAAAVAFLIGFFILLLSALVFFAGGVSTKFCEDLSPPDYILFKRVNKCRVVCGTIY